MSPRQLAAKTKMQYRYLHWSHLGIALLAVVLFFLASHSALLRNAEFNTLDARLKLRGPLPTPGHTVIVGIDQQSYDDLGQVFPWPRRYYAKLLTNLTRAGARVVVFDLIFDAPGADPEGDRAFAEAITAHGRVVLGVKQETLQGEILGKRLSYPVSPLREAAAGLGLVDRLEDGDGFTRRYRLAVPTDDGITYSLGLEALRLYHAASGEIDIVDEGRTVRIGPDRIPRLDATSFAIDYLGGPGTISTYSFSSVIDDATFQLPAGMDIDAFEFQKGQFADKIVIVGATMPELQDFIRSPFFESASGQLRLTPGAEMHASAIETVLANNHYRRPSPWQRLPLILLPVLLVLIATIRFKPLVSLSLAVVLVAGFIALAFWLFIANRFVLEIVATAGAMIFCHGGSTTYFFVKERQERRRIRGMFAMYVPDKVIKVLYENPQLMNLGGEERELTILFSDLAGFTPFSEGLSPTELVTLLNEYLSEMTDIVLAHDGIIDKYEGDLIMAEFGAPLHDPDHALKACQAALQMQERLAELRTLWREQGREPLFARIGVNTGSVVLGNMGSRTVHDYTVLGDAVNLASRLEGANKIYRTSIMISESTQAQTGDSLPARELDRIRVKGKARPVTVFELRPAVTSDERNAEDTLLAEYDAGLKEYRAGRWQEAEARFRAALACNPEDGPSREFLARVQRFAATPPDGDWNAVFNLRGE
ncbi:MAG: adenylate/guanylate cyclase domain-containing protein [bacterium]|nr:adenylate/guanylate cyclase domain-containing protein [bacterium]